jgi:hypothetical protein
MAGLTVAALDRLERQSIACGHSDPMMIG